MKKIFSLLSILCLLCLWSLLSSNVFAGTITKTTYEEFYRYDDFADWLDGTETISSCEVKIYERDTGRISSLFWFPMSAVKPLKSYTN